MPTVSKWPIAALAAATIAAGGCGFGSDDDGGVAAGGTLVLDLAEQNGSGQRGTATFTSVAPGRTRIVLELTDPPDVPQPAHVHSGSCDDLGPPVIPLADVEEGRSVTEAETPFEELAGSELVIHAHKSEAEFEVSVACAPLSGGD